ncbi:MAG: TrbI/VirB10 family protein [Terricaulis sp.]
MNAAVPQSEAQEQTQPDVAIRARPPSPKRLSRKVLLAGTGAAGLIIAFALVSGLSERPDRRGGATEAAVAAAGGPPESIQQAASGYDAADLPRGLIEIEEPLQPEGDAGVLLPPEDPIWSSRAPEGPRQTARADTAPADPQAVARASPILFGAGPAQAQARDNNDRLEARLSPPRSRFEIQAGQVIPAALVTALNSELPGRVIAQVTAPVFDSVSGDYLLIPQGARLIGTYQSGTRYGDHRILLAWNRLILPNGWSIDLDGMEASDPSGASGLSDRTDNHLDRLAAAVVLSSIISVIANEAENDDEGASLTQSLGDTAAQQAAQTGSRIVDRDLTVRPTLRVREGAPVRVLVTRDIALRPVSR